ncbi:hypothetical protein THOG05_20095 [Vibrio rotiferianus]|nr:hypothetical protein THOG05_20095 [Vibrio rotiferianus]
MGTMYHSLVPVLGTGHNIQLRIIVNLVVFLKSSHILIN